MVAQVVYKTARNSQMNAATRRERGDFLWLVGFFHSSPFSCLSIKSRKSSETCLKQTKPIIIAQQQQH